MKTRRIFIKNTLAGVAAISIADKGFASILLPKVKEKLGVALVGLGYYSTDLLAPALQLTSHCYLAGIVTGTPEKASRWHVLKMLEVFFQLPAIHLSKDQLYP